MRKLFLILWVLVILAGLLWLPDSQAGIYNNSGTTSEDSICIVGWNLDSTGRICLPITAANDSLYVLVWYPGGTLAFRDSMLMNDAQITLAAFEDASTAAGFSYKCAVADIDGAGQNGVYKVQWFLRDVSALNTTMGKDEAQVYATANYSVWADGVMQETDSALVDGSTLAGLTGAISATTIAPDAIGSSEIASGAIAAGTEATGFSTLTASDNIGINADDVSGDFDSTLFNANFKVMMVLLTRTGAWSSASVRALTELDEDNTTIDINATGTGAAASVTAGVTVTTNNDKTGYALTSVYPDSSALSRILGRKIWGIAAGTGADSVAFASRLIGNPGSGSGISVAQLDSVMRDVFGDSLAVFVGPDSLVYLVWNYGNKQLTKIDEDSTTLDFDNTAFLRLVQFDEDNTTIDIDGTTLGTVTSLTNKTGFVLAITGLDTDSSFANLQTLAQTLSTLATAIKAKTDKLIFDANDSLIIEREGLPVASVSIDSTDKADIADQVSASVGAAVKYPALERFAIVDFAGTLTKFQFVIDTTAVGGSNEYALVNKGVTLRDTSTSWGKPYFRGVIERVNCVADMCTLQISDSCAFPIAAGDTVWFWGDGPQYVMATLAEANAANADTLLGRDSTGQSAGTIGQAIVDGGTGGSDTTGIKTMLQNMGLPVGLDSLAKLSQNTTSAGTLRRGEVPTLAESADSNSNRMQNPGVNVSSVKGDTAAASQLYEAFDNDATAAGRIVYADSAGNAGSLTLTDENIDSIAAKIIAGGGSQLGSGTAQACTLFVMNGATPVPDAYIRILNTAETQQYAAWYSDVNGRRIFNLDDGSYKVRVRLLGYNQTTNPQTVVVSSGANDTIQLSVYDPDPRKAIFAMNLSSLDSSFRFAKADFTLMNLVKDDILIDTSGSAIAIGLPQVVKTRAVGDGVLTVALYKNSNMRWYKTPNTASNKTYWRVRIAKEGKDVSNPDLQFNIAIPSDSTYYRVTGGF